MGISAEEALLLLRNDIKKVRNSLNGISWFWGLDEVRQHVVISMAFNMGFKTFMTFKNTIADIKDGEYEEAAIKMLKSKWASQVGARAQRLAVMMQRGVYPS